MKKNKKFIIMIISVIVLALIILIISLSNGNEKLIFVCNSETKTSEKYNMTRVVELYEKGENLVYIDTISINLIEDNDSNRKAVENLLAIYSEENSEYDVFSYNITGNNYNLVLKIDTSKYSSEQVTEILDLENPSIVGIKEKLEESDLVCEKQ